MNYPMYGNSNQYYMQNLQDMRNRIDKQMQDIQQAQNQQQAQMPQVPQVTQNFQLAPTQSQSEFDGKYANDIAGVKNTLVLKNTLFVNKDMNTLWLKNVSGDVKTYTLTEVIELDPRDKEIAELKHQVAMMQEMIAMQKKASVPTVEETENLVANIKTDKKKNSKE